MKGGHCYVAVRMGKPTARGCAGFRRCIAPGRSWDRRLVRRTWLFRVRSMEKARNVELGGRDPFGNGPVSCARYRLGDIYMDAGYCWIETLTGMPQWRRQ